LSLVLLFRIIQNIPTLPNSEGKKGKGKESIGEIETGEERAKRQNFVKRGNKLCGAKVIQETEVMS